MDRWTECEASHAAARAPLPVRDADAPARSRAQIALFVGLLVLAVFNVLAMAGQIGAADAIAAPASATTLSSFHACGAPLA
ncbi:hypothetical protein [Novosphingobium sp. 9]|uniref:hypothetical protein n=1 Tax=Novosphingobium sp. 9 TaxID=2025349 RepID=UPI0021B4E1BE|nr:hypothetical protein [Novosphingobium sp. 9]